jgi:hypothetical protein
MDGRTRSRRLPLRILGLIVLIPCALSADKAQAGLQRRVEPETVIPLDQVAPERRDEVAEVIRDASFRRQGKPETFPCNPRIYLSLLNEPAMTLALWQDLGSTPAKLRQVGPNRYQGTDGAGTTATWEYVIRTPRLHVLFCNLNYVGPRGNTKLDGRIVLIVRSGFFKEVNGESWVQHDLEAYVKIDSKGWKAVAVTVRPLIEKLLEDQVREAGWFVSLMARLVEMHPTWATSVAMKQEHILPETRQGFRSLVAQTRRPGASEGRPVLAENTTDATTMRR